MVIAEHRIHYLRDLVDQVYRVVNGEIAETLSGTEFFSLSETDRQDRGLRALRPPEVNLAMPTGTGLEISDLRFSYGSRPVLHIDHLTFPAGAITALAGPNGVGKSTLARVICGLATPDSGTLSLTGQTLNARNRQRACAIVMQDVGRQLFGEFVDEEVTLGLGSQACDVDTTAILESLDLADLAERHPLSLSGGQQQRLAIAAALAGNKQVVIFDEPTSGVDAQHLHSIAQRLLELKKRGAVVIVITHDPELIAACGDYLVSLRPLTSTTHSSLERTSL